MKEICIKNIDIKEEDVLIINGALTLSIVQGNSALPVITGNAIKVSGNLDINPVGYSPGNSGYKFRTYKNESVFVQPGITIPHESQLLPCYLVADGGMFWRTTYPISHPNKVYETEENSMFWKHGEIVCNEEFGESTFPEINKTVEELWKTVGFPLLQKQLKELAQSGD